MKTRLLIIIGIIVIGIVSTWAITTFVDIGMDQKYQYRFWQKNIEFENDIYYLRVLFSRSDDYGKTFSEPIDMSMTNLNAHEPKIILMSKEVILVWRDEVYDIPTLSFAKSTDLGETFEKKRLFYGARPDIKHYGETLYLTYIDLESRGEVWYSKSNDRGETFSEPKLIFKVDWQLDPYNEGAIPIIDVDADNVTITWKMYDKDWQYTVWKAVDYGKDGTFEVTSFPEIRK
ncbi:MAG: exo-alpha-sialidase [Nitrosarchaeum sp.]|nr:MAG: exo-alpha-sialidase [Nitrosarchaeum sp.]